jgi:hypothetical protein
MGLDSGVCSFYDQIELDSDELKVLSKSSFVYRKVTYNVNDFLYIQIILQQFADFPDETIRRSAFVSGHLLKMEQRRHTKLVMKKKTQVMRGENLNPSAATGPASRRKVMRATTTKLINKI